MNVFEDVVRDLDGVIVAGANVYVYASDGSLASLFEADGATTKANPLASDDKGQVKAWLADGYYTLEYLWGGRKRYVRANILVGTAPLDAAVASAEDARDAAEGFADDAANSVGAVKQLIELALQPDAGLSEGAWYGQFFVPTDTTFTLFRHWIYLGTGTCDASINVNDAYALGPYPVTTTQDSDVISLTVSAGQRVSIQIDNISGSPQAIAVQMEGLPA